MKTANKSQGIISNYKTRRQSVLIISVTICSSCNYWERVFFQDKAKKKSFGESCTQCVK